MFKSLYVGEVRDRDDHDSLQAQRGFVAPNARAARDAAEAWAKMEAQTLEARQKAAGCTGVDIRIVVYCVEMEELH